LTWLRTIAELLTLAVSRFRAWFGPALPLFVLLIPVAVMALALAGYAWWWRIVADGVRENVMALQTEQRALGRNLEWDSLAIEGFPYTVEATLSKARMLAPDTGAAWDGERIVVHLQPLALNSIELSLEGEQHLFYVGEGRWLETDARADKAHFSAASTSRAQTLSVDIKRLTGKGKIDAADFNFIVEDVTSDIALRAISNDEPLPRIDIAAHVKNVALQGNFDLPLGPAIELFEIDIGLTLPEKLPTGSTNALIAAWQQTNTPVDIRRFEIEWGGISVSASGGLKLDVRNLPQGRLSLTLGNHPRILELLEANGWISKETHQASKPVLDVLAFVSGDPKRRITVPLRFEDGDVYLGPARVMKMQPPAPPEP
jgi:hypothetical protein